MHLSDMRKKILLYVLVAAALILAIVRITNAYADLEDAEMQRSIQAPTPPPPPPPPHESLPKTLPPYEHAPTVPDQNLPYCYPNCDNIKRI
jgi:hypothetical protein